MQVLTCSKILLFITILLLLGPLRQNAIFFIVIEIFVAY